MRGLRITCSFQHNALRRCASDAGIVVQGPPPPPGGENLSHGGHSAGVAGGGQTAMHAAGRPVRRRPRAIHRLLALIPRSPDQRRPRRDRRRGRRRGHSGPTPAPLRRGGRRRVGGGGWRQRRRIRRRLRRRVLLGRDVGLHRRWLRARGPLPHQREDLEELCSHALLLEALVQQSLALRRELARRAAPRLPCRRGAFSSSSCSRISKRGRRRGRGRRVRRMACCLHALCHLDHSLVSAGEEDVELVLRARGELRLLNPFPSPGIEHFA